MLSCLCLQQKLSRFNDSYMKAIFIRGGASTGIKKTYEKVNALSLRYFKQMKYRSIPL